MKRCIRTHAFSGMLAFFMMSNAALAQTPELDGYWLQIDDHDGRPLSIIRVHSEGKIVSGRVEEIFLPPGMAEPRCNNCPGSKAGKPIRGMQIISVSRTSEKEWNGSIFDPASGKEYKSRMELSADGKMLKVRGYIAIPTFGRTQLWRRFGSLK